MRLVVARGHNHHRLFQKKWLKQGKMPIAPLEVPPELKVMGVKIHDALDVAKGNENQKFEIMTLENSMKKYYLFDDKVRVIGDESHVLVLTKTLSYDGLPASITSLNGMLSLPDQDTLIQNSILQAIARDGHQDRLPKLVDIKQPGYIFPRVYGTRYKRKAANLMQKLACLSEMASGRYPESLHRARNIDAFTELHIERAGDPVTFQMTADIVLTSKFPLEPIATPEEVEDTKNNDLASIYPIKPTLDLWQLEEKPIMFKGIDYSDSNPLSNYHLHTLHLVKQTFGFWNSAQKLSRAIALCFTFAAEEARRLYGNDIKILPKPVTVQMVYSDIQFIGFLVYQLNTLDLADNHGIKNQAWIENEETMYSEVSELKGISEYNTSFFSKMLAFYMNGLREVTY